MTSDGRTEPTTTVLLDGTTPDYKMVSADNGQTIYPVCLVYPTGTAPDPEVSVASQYYGDAVKTESELWLVEIPASHPSFPKAYDKDTAFTAEQDMFAVHRLHVNDKVWLRADSDSITVGEDDIVIVNGSGKVIAPAGTTTIDKYNLHAFRVIGEWTTAKYIQAQYIGRLAADVSA